MYVNNAERERERDRGRDAMCNILTCSVIAGRKLCQIEIRLSLTSDLIVNVLFTNNTLNVRVTQSQ